MTVEKSDHSNLQKAKNTATDANYIEMLCIFIFICLYIISIKSLVLLITVVCRFLTEKMKAVI